MLGVRRAGVTDAIHALVGRGMIRSDRGQIEVIDREGLIEWADGCYGVPEREHERLIGDHARTDLVSAVGIYPLSAVQNRTGP